MQLYNALNLPSLRCRHHGPLAQKRVVFGQTVYWEEYNNNDASTVGRHVTGDSLEPYRMIGDPEVDDILEAFATEGRPIGPGTELFERIESPQSSSAAEQQLAQLIQTYENPPPWDIDWDQLERGRRVFLHYLPAIGLSLYYRSLVPGFSIPKIARVLQNTGYLAPPSRHVGERLMDTGAWLVAIFASDEIATLQPGGDAWKYCLQVRVLHAKVRRALLQSSKWDIEMYGIPINQEDMAATLLAFSINSIFGIELVLMGMSRISKQEQEDCIALWRYIGWLLGVHVGLNASTIRPLDPCGPGWIEEHPDSMAHSYAIFESIISHLMKPDESSVQISHHLLCMGGAQDDKGTADNQVWFYRRAHQCRRFIGDPLADALLFPLRDTWWGRFYIYQWTTLRMVLISFYTIIGLPWSPFRRLLRWYHRKGLTRFLTYWKDEHPKRIRDRLNSKSSCPFAMIAPP